MGNVDGPNAECKCERQHGGCIIIRKAPAYMACRCKYIPWIRSGTCFGFHTDCLDPDHRKCKKPDNSFAACQLGGGNCDGYKDSCDCDYRSGGCIISESARPSSACRCKYLCFWTCSGSTVKCPVFTSKRCQYPDRSKASCIFGDGDCGGY